MRVFAALRAAAARDPELLALLDAYEHGHHVESDAEARTGVAGQAFKNLVRRFKTVRHHLPDELRCAALEVMTRHGGAPVASIARHRGRMVDVVADGQAANDHADSVDALAPASYAPANDSGGSLSALNMSNDGCERRWCGRAGRSRRGVTPSAETRLVTSDDVLASS